MVTVADILAIGLNAKPKVRKAGPVCLDGEIDQALADLNKRLLVAKAEDEDSFTGGSERTVLKEIEKLKARASKSAVTFHMRRLDPLRVLEIQVEHPPRDDDASDKAMGYNRATYYPALMRECTFQVSHADGTHVDATELTDEWWTSVFAAVNLAQFNDLFTTAQEVNQGDAAAPFLLAASPSSTSNGGASKPPKNGTSPRKGSKAGSRARKSQSSSGSKTEPPADG